MKTYLELEGKLGAQPQLQPHTSTSSPDKNSLPQKTLVPKKAEKKKRAKAPAKRRFKVRVFTQVMSTNPSLPINPTLSTDLTPTVVTTMATVAQMPVEKPKMAVTKSIPVTVYNLVQGKFKDIPYPVGKSHEEEGLSIPSGKNPLVEQQPKVTATATALQSREKSHG